MKYLIRTKSRVEKGNLLKGNEQDHARALFSRVVGSKNLVEFRIYKTMWERIRDIWNRKPQDTQERDTSGLRVVVDNTKRRI